MLKVYYPRIVAVFRRCKKDHFRDQFICTWPGHARPTGAAPLELRSDGRQLGSYWSVTNGFPRRVRRRVHG